MKPEPLYALKNYLPAPILSMCINNHIFYSTFTVKDILRPTRKFRVEENEHFLFLVLHLVSHTGNNHNSQSPKSARGGGINEISTIRLLVYLFFEESIFSFFSFFLFLSRFRLDMCVYILVTVTENGDTFLADCILTRLSREASRIRTCDASYLLYYILLHVTTMIWLTVFTYIKIHYISTSIDNKLPLTVSGNHGRKNYFPRDWAFFLPEYISRDSRMDLVGLQENRLTPFRKYDESYSNCDCAWQIWGRW